MKSNQKQTNPKTSRTNKSIPKQKSLGNKVGKNSRSDFRKREQVKNEFARQNEEVRRFEATKDDVHNDISWYTADPQILNDIASLPFSNVLSDKIILDKINYSDVHYNANYYTPGVLTINIQNMYGWGTNTGSIPDEMKTDPLNIAAKSVYSFVRKHNSGAANYDEVDLMQYFIAMDFIYSLWAWCVRVYGIARTYNYKNRYVPNALLGAMGLSTAQINNLYQNLAGFRYFINNTAIRMSSLAVPTVMPIFKRHFWLYSNIFLDADDPKAQIYLYNMQSIGTYDEAHGLVTYNDLAPMLTSTDIVGAIKSVFDSMLEPMLYSQSIGIMSGDVLKAYEGNIYAFSPIDENFTVVPVYNEKILPQIHNLKVSGWKASSIQQSNNYLYTMITDNGNFNNNVTNFSEISHNCQRIFNLPYQNPNPEDVMYGTRLMSVPSYNDLSDVTLLCGSENVVSLRIVHDVAAGQDTNIWGSKWFNKICNTMFIKETDATGLLFVSSLQSLLNQFDWSPIIETTVQLDNHTVVRDLFNGDLANYTIVDDELLKKLHSGAFCGLYGIPYTLTRA